jgi:hypothetical protein
LPGGDAVHHLVGALPAGRVARDLEIRDDTCLAWRCNRGDDPGQSLSVRYVSHVFRGACAALDDHGGIGPLPLDFLQPAGSG